MRLARPVSTSSPRRSLRTLVVGPAVASVVLAGAAVLSPLAAGPSLAAGSAAAADVPYLRQAVERVATQTTAQVAGQVSGQVAQAASANPSNPLAGRTWGVYKGNADQAWKPYASSSGTKRRLLGKIALRPKAKWFGQWISNATVQKKVREYIVNSQHGDRDALVQMTVFRMVPWEHAACDRLPTKAQQASYKTWIRRFAAGIGTTHVALILQPDGPFALCAPHGSTLPSRLVAYATRKFSALPHTSVYIDGGASDWPARNPALSATILQRAGVSYARGFALNSTHYSTTADNIEYGAQVRAVLAKRGIPGKHFVVNTSSNGRGFTFSKARGSHPDNAKTCATKAERVCVTLGIPPTAKVANARWHLSATNRTRARRYVDGYLWFGRPWLFMQADPFSMPRALNLARTTPY